MQFGRRRSVNHTFEYCATLSFFIFTFDKSIYKSCKFADLGFQGINVISLVLLFVGTSVFRGFEVDLLLADKILFSACSPLAWSGIMVVNSCLRASMASGSALTFLIFLLRDHDGGGPVPLLRRSFASQC